MAYSTGRLQCGTDDSCKQAGVFNCRGCGKTFCSKHVSNHREKMNEAMISIITEHDQLKTIFSQHTSNPDMHLLIKQIDEWEKNSIEKIHLKAKELREQLLEPTARQIEQLSKRIEPITEQITKAHDLDDFVETDLAWWIEKLNLLKSDLTSPIHFEINEEEIPLVQNISVILKTINEQFDGISDDKVSITENGQVAIHNDTVGYTEVRGINEYSSGCHKIRLRIESLSSISLYLGINSKQTSLQNTSYSGKSAYLWYSGNSTFSNGISRSIISNPGIEMNKYDIIILIFDCDNQKISMINERTKIQHDLEVDINQCPFPWQFHMNMYYPNESVRILPS